MSIWSMGIQASNVALAVLNYMKQQKAFYVVSGAGTDAITWDRYPYLFRTSISTYQLSARRWRDYVYDNLGKEIVTTASDYAGGHDVMAQFKGPYLAKGGKVLKEIWPPLGTTDFSAYLTDIKSINPPVTYDFMPGADARALHPAIFRIRPERENAADRLHHHRFADGQRARQDPPSASFPRSLTPTRSTIPRARNSPQTSRRNTNTRRICSPTMAMSAPRRSPRR